jgi:septum formation protein
MLIPMATTVIPLLSSLNTNNVVILASGSPRRKELMQLMGFTNTIIRVSTFAENLNKASFPTAADYCLATALEKGKDVVDAMHLSGEWKQNIILISADTIVEIDNKILEKPGSHEEATHMLNMLSGNYHTVHTGVAIYTYNKNFISDSMTLSYDIKSFIESTRVKFDKLSAEDIKAYIETGEPFDKAGGYGIQGIGGQMVESVEGCYFNVMGLPIRTLSKAIAKLHNEGII